VITWIEKENLNENLSQYIEEILGIEVHPAALRHLSGDSVSKRIPFPRLEKHEGYLFGITYIPSNTENPSADFDAVIFAANHDSVVARIIEFEDETSTLLWDDLKPKLANVNSEDSTADGGEFILNLFRETTYLLWEDAENIRTFLDKRLDMDGGAERLAIGDIGAKHDRLNQKARQALLRELNKLSPTMSIISTEMNQMKRVAEESELILRALCNDEDQYDLRVDLRGQERELFSPDLEIYLRDTWELCRTLVATLNEIEALIEEANKSINLLTDQENVYASRATGAIAAALLAPSFLVGLWGMNFSSMPELNWKFGYLFAVGFMVSLGLFILLAFKKKKWI
jgi:magnesium transporter